MTDATHADASGRCTPAPRRCRPPHASLAGALVAVALAALAFAPAARADICKYQDAEGNVHYSNVPPEKGWRRLSCTSGEGSSSPRPAASGRAASSPAGFPRVDAETQKGRDDVRRKVLAEELAAEEKLLAESRAAYAGGAPVPLPEERADAERYRQRIARLRQSVALHEKNIEALKKELALVK